jgi:nucleotide-binding universal stress UspA family protein
MSDAQLAGGILCPVDLNDQSVCVVRLAASFANACAVPLVLLHALEDDVPPYFTQGGVERIEAEIEQARSAARQKLASLVKAAGSIPAPEIRVEGGDPPSVIRRLSESLGMAMIVMGTHKRAGLARIEEGSIAEAVLRYSTIPVLTVGLTDRIATPPSIVCAVTDSALSRISMSWAVRMAQCLGTRLTVLHVVEPGNPATISDLCAWVGHDRKPACHIQEVTRHGDPAEEILGLAGELGAGLLVIGAEHKLISDKTVIGTTAEKLLRQSPCPVLTVLGGRNASGSPAQAA